MLLRLRRSTLPAASALRVRDRRICGDALQDHQCQLEKTGEAVKYVLVYLVLSQTQNVRTFEKKGTLCGETLGPEKGSATLENIDCAMGLRSTREYGTATSAAKSEHQAEIYADYTYTGYMRMRCCATYISVYLGTTWRPMTEGAQTWFTKFPMCDRPREGMSYFDPYIITPPSTAASRSGPCRRAELRAIKSRRNAPAAIDGVQGCRCLLPGCVFDT